jgi:tape measure domain-containing protein
MAIEVKVISNSAEARADMEKLRQSVDRVGNSAEKTVSDIKALAVGLAASLASFATIKSLSGLLDDMTALNSKLKIATDTQENFNDALKQTRRIAISTSQSLDSVTGLFSKISLASKELGASQEDVLEVTRNVAKSLAVASGSAGEASAAITQLGQALGSGRLQGDELRSILENAQPLAQMIAKGLGVSISQMRKLGSEGALTSERVFAAILSQTESINSQLDKVTTTMGKAMSNFKTAASVFFKQTVDYLNEVEEGQASFSLAEMINDFAKSLLAASEKVEIFGTKLRVKLLIAFIEFKEKLKDLPTFVRTVMYDATVAVLAGLLKLSSTIRDKAGAVWDTLKSALEGVGIRLPEIDVMKIFPNLQKGLNFIWEWAAKAERAFWWLWDRVIGHSWIPDLVGDTGSELEKLHDKPLKEVTTFTQRASNLFKELFKAVSETPFVEGLVSRIKALYSQISRLTVVRDLKQSLGIKDNFAGKYADRNSPTGYSEYDTKANVGRGPQRNKTKRPLFHDILNSFSPSNQVPVVASLTAALINGLVAAVSSGSVLLGLIAAFGTAIAVAVGSLHSKFIPIGAAVAAGIIAGMSSNPFTKVAAGLIGIGATTVAVKTIDPRELRQTADDILGKIQSTINWVVRKVFGEGIFGDHGFGGLIANLLKVGVLFAAGRAAIGKGIGALAKAPMRLGETAALGAGSMLTERRLNEQRAALKSGSLSASDSAKVRADIKALSASQTKLNETLVARREAAREGIRNAGANVGAALGAFGGFQVGGMIADQMTNSPAWQKIGVQIGTAAAGQALGAGLGSLVAGFLPVALSALKFAVVSIGALLFANPVILGILVAVAAAFALFTGSLDDIGKSLVDMGRVVSDVIGDLAKKAGDSLAKVSKDFEDTIYKRVAAFFGVKINTDLPGEVKDKGKNAELEIERLLKERSGFRTGLSVAEAVPGLGPMLRHALAPLATAVTERMDPGHTAGIDAQIAHHTKLLTEAVAEGYQTNSALLRQTIPAAADKALTAVVGKAEASVNTKPNEDVKANIDALFKNLPKEDRLKAFGDLIAKSEGVKHGFNTLFGNTEITDLSAHPNIVKKFTQTDGTTNSTTAAGAWQFIKPTWDGLAKKLELKDFSADSQTKAFTELLKERKALDLVMEGDVTKAIEKLGSTFVSLPTGTAKQNTRSWEKTQEFASESVDNAKNGSTLFDESKGRIKQGISKLGDFFTKTVEPALKSMGLPVDKIKEAFGKTGEAVDTLKKDVAAAAGPESAPVKKLLAIDQELLDANEDFNTFIKQSINPRLAEIFATQVDINSLTEADADLVENIYELFKIQEELINKIREMGKDGDINDIKRLQLELRSVDRRILKTAKPFEKTVQSGDERVSTEIKEAGGKVAKNLSDGISAEMIAAFSGKKTFKEAATAMSENLANTIIDTMFRSFFNAFNKATKFEETMADFFTSFINNFTKAGTAAGDAVTSLKGSPIEQSIDDKIWNSVDVPSYSDYTKETEKKLAGGGISDVVDTSVSNTTFLSSAIDDTTRAVVGIGDVITDGVVSSGDAIVQAFTSMVAMSGGGGGGSGGLSGLGGLGSLIGSGLSDGLGEIAGSIMGAFGVNFFASGGYVSGPGSTTSDSIPALLSNKEFVVNAKQTAKYRDLLERINSGSFPRFSQGGLVTSASASKNDLIVAPSIGGKSEQKVFNINITGDVSRQTRQEIQKMIPNIATGVDTYHTERGTRL